MPYFYIVKKFASNFFIKIFPIFLQKGIDKNGKAWYNIKAVDATGTKSRKNKKT